MVTATSQRPPRALSYLPTALIGVALIWLLAGGVLGCARGRTAARAVAKSTAFSWFRAAPPPSDWSQLALPDGHAVLSYPPSLHRIRSDSGAVSAAWMSRSGRYLVYLNATPQQSAESLADWTRFRVGHLAQDADHDVALEAAVVGLSFRGGPGSCVIDHYTTDVVPRQYKEIACLVQGRSGADVLVGAAPLADWPQYAPLLERAVESFRVS